MNRSLQILRSLFLLVFTVGALAASIFAAQYLMSNKPQPHRAAHARMAPLVEVSPLHPTSEQIVIPAMGTVIPAVEITLRARVSGEIVATGPEFIEGGIVEKGAVLVSIDPKDYELALIGKEAEVERARFELKVEQGEQNIAQWRWETEGLEHRVSEIGKELALRLPHLEQKKAGLRAAEAQLEKARLDLERTRVTAPFNAIVQSADVDLGSQATPQTELARLVGADAYWIRVSVPIDRLKWIRIPNGAGETYTKASIWTGTGGKRIGRVLKLLSDLEPTGRLARLIVEIADPLDSSAPPENRNPLLIGEYVRVELEGKTLEDIYSIPRVAMRDGSRIWLMDESDRLQIEQVDVIWADAEHALVAGLSPGARLIVSDLPAPVQGMEIRLRKTTPMPGAAAPRADRGPQLAHRSGTGAANIPGEPVRGGR